jgi:endonuclease/exonuclease/phosphatase family metal-dependent hydrolase
MVPKSLKPGGLYKIKVTVNGKTTASQYKFKVSTPPDIVGKVPIDGTLEAVTWNIRQYKAKNEVKTNEIVEVLDSLHADFYALEELYYGQKTLDSLVYKMKGYHGIYIHTENEANAIIYNTNAIDSVSSGQIQKYQMLKPWAERLPYYFSFNYHPDKGKPAIRVYAVVIHAKAQTGSDAYSRRVEAANELHKYLNKVKPDAKMIILGDFNDELNTSIVKGKPSSYKIFVQDSTRYDPITIALSQHHKTSEANPRYQSVIDNIIISNEMVKYYEKGSARIFIPSNDFIPDYFKTLSDHYPVEAKFDMRR